MQNDLKVLVDSPASTLAAPAVAAFAITGWIVLASIGSQLGTTSTIFVGRDVAAVYFLCLLPLASFLAMHLQPHASALSLMIVAVLSLAVSLPMIPDPLIESGSVFAGSLTASVIRTFAAFGLAMASVLLVTALLPRPQGRIRSLGWELVISTGFGVLVATILPTIYVQARCRHGAMLLDELREQSRFGEARTHIRELLRLSPSMESKGRSLKNVSLDLDRSVRDLESQFAASLQKPDTDEQNLLRCRQLAMLGRNSEALARVMPLLDSSVGPAACDLCGTIYETTCQWETARSYHDRAKEKWFSWPSPLERHAGMIRTATRLAYCERKLGHFDLAETEYCEVLAQSPTADSYFLLAQFYEDMQHSAKARAYARRAMALAPQRYLQAGTKLIDKLMVGHFGCLGVFSAELPESRSAASIPSGSGLDRFAGPRD